MSTRIQSLSQRPVWAEAAAHPPPPKAEFETGDTIIGDVKGHQETKSQVRAVLVSALQHTIHSYRLDIQSALTAITAKLAPDIRKLSKSNISTIISLSTTLFSAVAAGLNIGHKVARAAVSSSIMGAGLTGARASQTVGDNVDRLTSAWGMFSMALGQVHAEKLVTDDMVEKVHAAVGGLEDWRKGVRELAPKLLDLPPDPAKEVVTQVITEIHIRNDKYLMTLDRRYIHPDTIITHRRKAAAEAKVLLDSLRETLPTHVRRAPEAT